MQNISLKSRVGLNSIFHLGLVTKFKQNDDKADQIYHSKQDKLSNITVLALSVRGSFSFT